MNAKVTDKDLFLYDANRLDPARGRAVEAALRTDPEARGRYAEQSDRPLPPLDLTSPVIRRAAALAFEVVALEELCDAWLAWVEAPVGPPPNITPSTLHNLPRGVRLYRDEVPATLAGRPVAGPAEPLTCPTIRPDYAAGRLTVCLPLDAVLDGVVEVVAVRRRGPSDVATFRLSRHQLERGTDKDGTPCWQDDIPLRKLTGPILKGDDFVYCVRPTNPLPAGGADE